MSLKFCGISGRLIDGWNYFFHQCAHWFQKYVSGAQVAGNGESSPRVFASNLEWFGQEE